MTYRKHRDASDRTYLAEMLHRYHTITRIARIGRVSRSTIYYIAKRSGFKLPQQAASNRGNERWQQLRSRASVS